jgi:hypothetical protein
VISHDQLVAFRIKLPVFQRLPHSLANTWQLGTDGIVRGADTRPASLMFRYLELARSLIVVFSPLSREHSVEISRYRTLATWAAASGALSSSASPERYYFGLRDGDIFIEDAEGLSYWT